MMSKELLNAIHWRFDSVEGVFASNKPIGIGNSYRLYDHKKYYFTIEGKNDKELINSLLTQIKSFKELYNTDGTTMMVQGIKEWVFPNDIKIVAKYNVVINDFGKHRVLNTYENSDTAIEVVKAIRKFTNDNKMADIKITAYEVITPKKLPIKRKVKNNEKNNLTL